MGTGSLPSSRRNSRPVIDWKIAASETSDYSPQLRVYALALARVRGMSPEDIARLELFEVNLLRNEIHYEVASPEVVEETRISCLGTLWNYRISSAVGTTPSLISMTLTSRVAQVVAASVRSPPCAQYHSTPRHLTTHQARDRKEDVRSRPRVDRTNSRLPSKVLPIRPPGGWLAAR